MNNLTTPQSLLYLLIITISNVSPRSSSDTTSKRYNIIGQIYKIKDLHDKISRKIILKTKSK